MTCRSNKGVIFIAAGVGLLFAKMQFLGWVLVYVGLALAFIGLFERKSGRRDRIRNEARRRGIRLVPEHKTYGLLRSIYELYDKSAKRFPEMKTDYDAIIDSMWEELGTTFQRAERVQILERVVKGWPTPWSEMEGPLSESLKRAQRSAQLRREAAWEAAQ